MRNAANCLLLAPLFFICATPAFAVTPENIPFEVLATYPHNSDSFCQGLLLYEGEFYESAGLYGMSSLRRVTVETGVVQQRIDIADEYFAEGLARVGDRLIQLTWREKVAFVYDIETFEQLGTFNYTGDGWGLCYDGSELVMSNGSRHLTFRDADTFEVLRTVGVTNGGVAVGNLNELECVGDVVYANMWLTNRILRIDRNSGDVTGIIDASILSDQQPGGANVLNCIAYNPGSDTYYITGKLWPNLYEIKLASSDTDIDNDGDGYSSDEDCDDNESSVYPGAPEICDGIDNDCEGTIPASEVDADGDTFMVCQNDCNDSDVNINPSVIELPGDLIDENCDGSLGDCDPGASWKNHGHFVRCVAHEVNSLVDAGYITKEEGDARISSAAQSDVGKK